MTPTSSYSRRWTERVGTRLFRWRGYTGALFFLIAYSIGTPTLRSWLLGLGLLAIGAFLRWLSVAYSGPTTRASTLTAPELVVSGPYAHVRNPIYLGNFLIGLGLLWMLSDWTPWINILFVLLFWFQYGLIVRAEEAYLHGKFGVTYEAYRKRVPRFLPRIRRVRWEHEQMPDFQAATRSERSTWLVLGIGILLALTKLSL